MKSRDCKINIDLEANYLYHSERGGRRYPEIVMPGEKWLRLDDAEVIKIAVMRSLEQVARIRKNGEFWWVGIGGKIINHNI